MRLLREVMTWEARVCCDTASRAPATLFGERVGQPPMTMTLFIYGSARIGPFCHGDGVHIPWAEVTAERFLEECEAITRTVGAKLLEQRDELAQIFEVQPFAEHEKPPHAYSTPGIGDVRRMLYRELVAGDFNEKELLALAMKRCGGQANPTHMREIIAELLKEAL